MFYSAAIARKINDFGKARSGSFAIMMAMVLAVLALSAGFAVNLAQLYNVRSSLRQALDAAVTSTSRDITTGKIVPDEARAWVELFLKSNGDPTFMGGDKLVLTQLTVDKVNSTIDATAYVDVDLYFPLFGLSDQRRVTGESASVYSDKKIEVAMMLDVTGSMDGQKIKDLRKAASNAVDTFLSGQDVSKPRVRVAIVPYANAVNTGSLQNVVFAEGKYTAGDAEPPKLDDPIAVSAYDAPDDCATERKGTQQFTDASPYTAKVNRDYRLDFCPSASLMPLSADATSLKTAIGKFKAGGYTAGHIGVQWSWYMLSPMWRDVLPKDAQPLDYDPKKVQKRRVQHGLCRGRQERHHDQPTHALAGQRRQALRQNARRWHRDIHRRLHAERRERQEDHAEMRFVGFRLDQALLRDEFRRRTQPGLPGDRSQHRAPRHHEIA